VADVYPDLPVEYLWDVSNRRIGADAMYTRGFTGRGMQIAVVDSGIDATHPDLARRVTRNVTIVGPEYVNLPPDTPPGTLVLAVDEGPYSNTDTDGHGTFIAGILAADGTTGPSQVGVAPEAELIGYSVGVGGTVRTTLSAFDHILDHPEWGIDVINNSWGIVNRSWFDPAHPLNVATRALSDQGIVVVFAAGNWGYENSEMSLNWFATPWVVSVGASDLTGQKADFSSNGLAMDNSEAVALVDGHARFTGDRLGFHRPSLLAPGVDIVSSCATAVTTAIVSLSPCLAGSVMTASGTSFAAPHVAGLVALLRQARPELTVAEVQRALEATARTSAQGLQAWQAGYGHVDGLAALDLVLRPDFKNRLPRLHAEVTAQLLALGEWRVPVSEFWGWIAARASVAGVPETHEFALVVPPDTDALKLTIGYPSPSNTATSPTNVSDDYTVSVFDAGGSLVGTTTPSSQVGVSSALIDLRNSNPVFGEWTLRVSGTHIDDPAVASLTTLPPAVLLQAALLQAQPPPSPPPPFVADGTMALFLTPDPARGTAALSPEDCELEAGTAMGELRATMPDGPCRSTQSGLVTGVVDTAGVNIFASFTGQPLDQELTIGGDATIVLHVRDLLLEATDGELIAIGFTARFDVRLEHVDANGLVTLLHQQEMRAFDGRNEGTITVAEPARVAAGNRLRLSIGMVGALSPSARLLFGGGQYGDSGITLGYRLADKAKPGQGAPSKGSGEGVVLGGATGATALVLLLGLAAVRRARRA
jgi:serine protease AprX